MVIKKSVSTEKTLQIHQSSSILVVIAPFYAEITKLLVQGAKTELSKYHIKQEMIEVPGALEIPTAIKLAAASFDGFVALGCVIRGETSHYETVCNDSSRALTLLGLEGICIGNGILTVENFKQAITRADPDMNNKGKDAALAALNLIQIKQRFEN